MAGLPRRRWCGRLGGAPRRSRRGIRGGLAGRSRCTRRGGRRGSRRGARSSHDRRASQLSVRLTRDVWDLEGRHIDLARAISLIARDHGAQANRAAVQEIQLAIAARPAEIDLGFWQAVLGYSPKAEDNAVDPLGHGSTVWMQDLDPAKQLRHAMHVDVSLAREEAETRVAAAVAAGGRVVVDAEAPRSWILSDRAGNRVCIACWPNGA